MIDGQRDLCFVRPLCHLPLTGKLPIPITCAVLNGYLPIAN